MKDYVWYWILCGGAMLLYGLTGNDLDGIILPAIVVGFGYTIMHLERISKK